MIYSFAAADLRKQEFITMLDQLGIDYELSEHNHTVVRVLGRITPEVREQLHNRGFDHASLTLQRPGERGCYDLLCDRSRLNVIAGPCAVEDEAQLAAVAEFLHRCDVRFLRGGAYKPRTQVDSFQGLGVNGLKLLRAQADRFGMFVVTEVMDRSQIDTVAEYADVLQVGSRNMFNYTLLTALGSINKPILLKRGMAATIREWLAAAEYISRGGNNAIILCERGVRTFEPEIAHTLDLAAIILAQQQSSYPVIADASHAAGRADLVAPLALAAVAAGADGIMIEVHPEPATALSDARQALTLAQFAALLERAQALFQNRRAQ